MKIVVINFTRMGDLIQSGPLLCALKRTNRDPHLTLVVLPEFQGVAERLPMVDSVSVFDANRLVPLLDERRSNLSEAVSLADRFLREAANESIDLLVNLAHTPQSAVLCRLLKSKQTWGLHQWANGARRLSGDWFCYLFSILGDRRRNPFNLVEIYRRMAPPAEPCNRLQFRVGSDDRSAAIALLRERGIGGKRPVIALQPGASDDNRKWPPDQFAELARRLAANGCDVVLLGSPSEDRLCEEIVGQSGHRAVSLAGTTSIGTLAGVLEQCACLISNDTGTIHLAAALKIPTVGIFVGPASAKDTAPYGNGHRILEPDVPCSPCSYQTICRHRRCHQQITAGAVTEVVLAVCRDSEVRPETLRGIRLYETWVEPGGALVLRALNESLTGPDHEMLSLYRRFWEAYLRETSLPRARQRSRRGHTISTRTMSRLTELTDRAESCTTSLKQMVMERASTNGSIAAAVRDQRSWQLQLFDLMETNPFLRPFLRYVKVRLDLVRSDSLENYVADLTDVAVCIRRGEDVWESALCVDASRPEVEIRV